MILLIYVLVKTLVKAILIDQIYSQDVVLNNNIKRNFKIIASIIYRETIEVIREKNSVLRKIADVNSFDDSYKGNKDFSRFFYDLDEKMIDGNIDKRYVVACRKIDRKKKNISEDNVVTADDMRQLAKITSRMQSYDPDKDPHDIFIISDKLCTTKEIGPFLTLAKESNFNQRVRIDDLVNKLLKLIQSLTLK